MVYINPASSLASSEANWWELIKRQNKTKTSHGLYRNNFQILTYLLYFLVYEHNEARALIRNKSPPPFFWFLWLNCLIKGFEAFWRKQSAHGMTISLLSSLLCASWTFGMHFVYSRRVWNSSLCQPWTKEVNSSLFCRSWTHVDSYSLYCICCISVKNHANWLGT